MLVVPPMMETYLLYICDVKRYLSGRFGGIGAEEGKGDDKATDVARSG
jgi:hypothetical protein